MMLLQDLTLSVKFYRNVNIRCVDENISNNYNLLREGALGAGGWERVPCAMP